MLALRALGLGDALTGVPALRGLRRAWPGARLVLAATAPLGGWLRDLGVVDAVLPVPGLVAPTPDALRQATAACPHPLDGAVDVAVNLHGAGPQSTAALAALQPGRLVAFTAPEGTATPQGTPTPQGSAAPEGPVWDAGEHEVARWCRLVSAVGGDCSPADLVLRDAQHRTSTTVVHPGAASASRRWPAERWVEVVRRLATGGRDVVVTGTAAEGDLCARVAAGGARDLCGALDLPALLDLVAGAALVLCGDTGVAHLATATRTPSVLLFGPTPPSAWGPVIDPERHAVLWPAPAAHVGDPHGADPDPALAATTPSDVLAAAARLVP